MNKCGKIVDIKLKKHTLFITIYNTKFQQLVVKEQINYYHKLLHIGDVIDCEVKIDCNNNSRFRSNYPSYMLKNLKMVSKNVEDFKLPLNLNLLQSYSEAIFNIRKYLHKLHYLEVNLPILTNGETSSKAKSFNTIYSKNNEKLFLRKTMDVFLRMYSCSNVNKVFAIGNCFRNEFVTSVNKPEFEMLSIFSNYMSKKSAVNLAINIIKKVTSKDIDIKFIDEFNYNNVQDDKAFYVISNFKNNTNSYCSLKTNEVTDEFKIKYKNVTIIHGVSEICDYEEYINKIRAQGMKKNYGELKLLERLINSGAPKCYNLGISLIRILSLYNNLKIKDYDMLSFDRLEDK